MAEYKNLIPGLDRFKCARCDWVANDFYLENLSQSIQKHQRQNNKKKTSLQRDFFEARNRRNKCQAAKQYDAIQDAIAG